jgi:hypothetical protein
MNVCPSCGAVEHGNLTCRVCRQNMRERSGPLKTLDLLDEMNIATVSPVGPDEIREFLERLRKAS